MYVHDPNMGSPQAKISQAKTNQGGYMAEQPTNWMFTNLPVALADFCIKAKEDHLQMGLNIIMDARNKHTLTKAWHEQRSKNRRLIPRIQVIEQAEHPPSCQPTLRAIERLAWCVFEHGISKNGISRHGILSQDLELAWRVLIEPTRPAPRSCVRLTFDNG